MVMMMSLPKNFLSDHEHEDMVLGDNCLPVGE